MTLTDKERHLLMHQAAIPEHIKWWTRQIALDPNPTELQITSARKLLAMTAYFRKKHWIFQDELRPRPQVEYIKVGKTRQKQHSR